MPSILESAIQAVTVFIASIVSPGAIDDPQQAALTTTCPIEDGTFAGIGCFIQLETYVLNFTVENQSYIRITHNTSVPTGPNTTVHTNQVNIQNGTVQVEEDTAIRAESITETDGTLNVSGTVRVTDLPPFDTTPPIINCNNCHRLTGQLFRFTPTVKDPEPSFGLNRTRICVDDGCSTVWCTNTTGTSCTVDRTAVSNTECQYRSQSYWIEATDRKNNTAVAQGGAIQIKKEIGCHCTADRQCYSGLCKKNVCARQNLVQIDLL